MKSYMIYLDHIPSQKAMAIDNILNATDHGVDIDLFPAYNPETGVAFLSERGIGYSTEIPYFSNLRPGEIGCLASHYRLWEMCVEADEEFYITEFDCKVIKPLPAVEYNEAAWLTNRSGPRAIHNPGKVSNNKFEWFPPGTYSYLIKPAGAQKLINAIKKYGILPSDVAAGAANLDIVYVRGHTELLHIKTSSTKNYKLITK